MTVRGAPAFEARLLSQRRHLAAASEAMLHEAALGATSRGINSLARDLAVRAVGMSPLDETHQALLITLYKLNGEDEAAEQQYAAFADTLHRELGASPGGAVRAALQRRPAVSGVVTDVQSVDAVVEAGVSALGAGAVDAGVDTLRTAVRLADVTGDASLRAVARQALAEALIHSVRGVDEEALALLHEADELAAVAGDRHQMALARTELGYVGYLRGRYDRAEFWLDDALELGEGSPSTMAKATTYLGSVESDRAAYGRARRLLEQALDPARSAGEPRRQAYALSMLGRLHLLRGEHDEAGERLRSATGLAESDHWLSFLPWPQALLGELHLACGDDGAASGALRQAFARACQQGDPCWEGIAARGLALVAEAEADTARAFELLADARTRCNRLADSYVWLDAYILDAQCLLGVEHGHRDTERWVDALRELASRTGMRELIVRAMLHGAALGHRGDAEAAVLLGSDIDNLSVQRLLAQV